VAPQFDLDIARFQVTKQVRLGGKKAPEVGIKLVVKNLSSIPGSALATVVGAQNGGTVFQVIDLEVSDPVGNGRTTVRFNYTADATGEIVWTATLEDGDPDVDLATATTQVK
jgi:hypothetical protein